MAAAKKKSSTPAPKPTTGASLPRKVSVGSDLDYVMAKKYPGSKRADMKLGKKAFIASFQDVVSEGEIKMPNGKYVSGTSANAQAAARRVATLRWEGSKDYYASNKIPTNKRGPKINPYKAFKK
jgi:hypothetical protein